MIELIRRQLDAEPVRFVIPADLRADFLSWRLRDLKRYLRVAAVPFILVTLALTLVSNRFFTGELGAEDTRLWLAGSIGVCSLVVGGLLLIQLPVLQRHYMPLASLLGVLLIGKFTAMPQLLSAPVAVAAESYFCMIMVVVVCLGLRFTLPRAALVCVAGGLLGLAFVTSVSARTIDWRSLSYYLVAITAVCLFILGLVEERAKMAFLQSRLIEADAREKEELNQELARLASIDSLTAVANRRTFDRALESEWERLGREARPLGVAFIDVDHFKRYNDHYGHGAGDAALAAVAAALQSALLRPADLVARYGGEEFVLLLPDTDLAGASEVASRALAAVDARALPHQASATAAHVTVSVGVATAVPAAGDSPAALLERADRALYAAKAAGRHQAVLSPPGAAVQLPA